MLVSDQLRRRVDDAIRESKFALAFAPRVDGLSSSRRLPGSYDVAMADYQKRIIKRLMRASGADGGLNRTLNRITNGEFTPSELNQLQERSLDKLDFRDALKLRGVEEGPPVMFRPKQKEIVDSLMGRLGDDPLAHKARDAYQRAIHARDVRVR